MNTRDWHRRDLVVLGAMVMLLSLPGSAQQEVKGQEAEQSYGFVSIFDGKSLTGWRALPEDSASDWSVNDGVIVGQGSADRLSYLVFQEEALSDFELKLRYRMKTKGNTGVEVRARIDTTGKRPLEGYHADLGHVGIGPQILGAWDFHFAKRKEHPCHRGMRLVIDKNQRGQQSKIPDAITLADIKKGDWNEVHIVARGGELKFSINGKRAAEFVDNYGDYLKKGAIGLQIHDKGMVVEFKDLKLKRVGE